MADILNQVTITIISAAILGLLAYIARHLLFRLWSTMIRCVKQRPIVLVSAYVVLLASLELGIILISADGFGKAIAIVQLPLLVVLAIILRERYSPPGLRIISAKYGARGQTNDVTRILRALVKDGMVDVTISNGLLGGDPYPGIAKQLDIYYVDRHAMTIEENERLDIPKSDINVHVTYGSLPSEDN